MSAAGKLRVAQFICPSGYYGAERWVVALAKHLDRDKVDCRLIVTKDNDDELEVCTHIDALGLPVDEISTWGRFDASAIYRLARLLRREQVQIVHTHGYKSDIIGYMAARLARIRCISTPHGFENAPDLKLKLYMGLGGKFFKRFDLVAPLSPQIERDLIDKYRVPTTKIQLVMNGVDLDEIGQLRNQTGHDRGLDAPFVIGYVGQLISRKNIESMLRAFATFHGDVPNSELRLVGDGDSRSSLESLAIELGVSDSVQFFGFRADRFSLMEQFDCFAMTSTLEGIPRCLMEAMAMEIPIVAYRIPGVDALMVHGESGLMPDFGDEHGLVDAWKSLAASRELRDELKRAARVEVEERFSAKRMANEYTEIYRQLIPHKRG